jgi:hypothetical protein
MFNFLKSKKTDEKTPTPTITHQAGATDLKPAYNAHDNNFPIN